MCFVVIVESANFGTSQSTESNGSGRWLCQKREAVFLVSSHSGLKGGRDIRVMSDDLKISYNISVFEKMQDFSLRNSHVSQAGGADFSRDFRTRYLVL